ncbi:hypothetical protein SELMODRAFT_415459 [Selaginella moellendorffii]|uniref:Cupin type-1 domain-containing protein n=1 Tax=Selaginella moellendorffii TaxID=88036 RepID=D8RW66_SELML|nr:hypothetical protein SELMODRAFT_415459 [Selaginella moellendorffii]
MATFLFCLAVLYASMSTLQALSSDPDLVRDFCVADLDHPRIPARVSLQAVCQRDDRRLRLQRLAHSCRPQPGPLGHQRHSSLRRDFSRTPSFARLDFVEGGLIPPHTHPRASEFVYITLGRFYAGFIDTANRAFARVYSKGVCESLLQGRGDDLPEGSHPLAAQCGRGFSVGFCSANSEKPGFQTIAPSMFGSGVTEEVLQKAFRLDAQTVHRLVEEFVPMAEFIRGTKNGRVVLLLSLVLDAHSRHSKFHARIACLLRCGPALSAAHQQQLLVQTIPQRDDRRLRLQRLARSIAGRTIEPIMTGPCVSIWSPGFAKALAKTMVSQHACNYRTAMKHLLRLRNRERNRLTVNPVKDET